MKALGLDLSTSKSGYALASDGVPEACGLWKPPSKLKLQEEKIDFMADHAQAMMAFTRPDIVIIEECGPQRNAKTFRALVRVDEACAREARKLRIPVLHVMVKAVREAGMGDGKMGKETVYLKLKERHPQFDWKEVDKGGDDMSDALLMSIAAQALADRR